MKRRTFLKTAGLMAGGLAASSALPDFVGGEAKAQSDSGPTLWTTVSNQPNILVILVDQLRFPQGLFNQELLDVAAPNLAQLRKESVSFDYHYAAATMCSPSRSTLLTGLYTHQTAMFLTQAKGLDGLGATPDLDPGFPTWGSILNSSDFRYNTYWWGKWHLSGNDQLTPDYAKQYGFTTGGLPCPAPDGGPGQGLGVDPVTTQVFKNWLDSITQSGPWCTTVGLVNPHDIAWYPKFTNGHQGQPPQPGEDDPPSIFDELPANFERWPEAGLPPDPSFPGRQGKPRMQQTDVEIIDFVMGVVPANPVLPEELELWYRFLDLYVQVTHYVDVQIGAVLTALAESAAANNTIVVFTSDHGEYGGSHGMRNKGFALYEESIHVPLYVYDPTNTVIPADQRGTVRNGLTSHVDITPLLMTLAGGNNAWRSLPEYAQLSGRADLVAMLSDPNAAGRDFIVHSSDEDIPEESFKAGASLGDINNIKDTQGNPPSHVIGYRTKDAKLGVYSFFEPGTINIEENGQEAELYNYAAYGLDEVINNAPGNVPHNASPGGSAPDPALFELLYIALFNPTTGAVDTELRQPLPSRLQPIQTRAINTYLAYEASLQNPLTPSVYMPLVQK